MTIDDLLKGILKIDKISIVIAPKIYLFSNNRSEKISKIDAKTIGINYQKLAKRDQESIKKILPQEQKNGVPIFDISSDTTIYEYKKVISETGNIELLQYFKDKLPIHDVLILRAALYIRTLFKEGKDIHQIRNELMQRYGTRAKNISNLCTAGYYESWIRPLYEEISKHSNFSQEKFLKIYEEIVTCYPFAMFVNRNMKEDDIKIQILKKIDQVKQYGLKILNIHGIGQNNIRRIHKTIEEIEKTIHFSKSMQEESNTIVVRLAFS